MATSKTDRFTFVEVDGDRVATVRRVNRPPQSTRLRDGTKDSDYIAGPADKFDSIIEALVDGLGELGEEFWWRCLDQLANFTEWVDGEVVGYEVYDPIDKAWKRVKASLFQIRLAGAFDQIVSDGKEEKLQYRVAA